MPLLCAGLLAVPCLGAEEEGPKAPRRYSNRVTFHEVDVGIRTPEEEKELRNTKAAETGDPLTPMPPLPVEANRALMQPSPDRTIQLRDEEPKKSNWILPPVAKDLKDRTSEKDASSGWGWLADDIDARESGDARQDEADLDEQDREWLDSQPKLNDGSLIDDQVFKPVAATKPLESTLMGDPIIHSGSANDEEIDARVRRAEEQLRREEVRKVREQARESESAGNRPLRETRPAWRRDRDADRALSRTQRFLDQMKTAADRPRLTNRSTPKPDDTAAARAAAPSRSGLSGLGALPDARSSVSGSLLSSRKGSLDTSIGSSFRDSYLNRDSRAGTVPSASPTPVSPSPGDARSLRGGAASAYDVNPYLQR